MSENNENNEWKKRELGALWRREGKNQNYLSGHVKIGEFGVEKEVKLVVFTNKYKSENSKAPDFILYEASDRTQENSNSQAEATTAQPAEDQTSDIPDMLEA